MARGSVRLRFKDQDDMRLAVLCRTDSGGGGG